MTPIWERIPDEPERWYTRFEVYRRMGPNRTLRGAYRLTAQTPGSARSKPGRTWYAAARRWRWAERAQAWDAAEAAQARDRLPDQAMDPQAQRRARVDELLNAVTDALRHANLDQMAEAEARQFLPTLRGLLRDLLTAQRTEEELARAGEQDAALAPFSADELRRAGAELERWYAGQMAGQWGPPARWLALRDVLAELYADEGSARRIAAQAGLSLGRISFSPLAVNNWHAILTEAARSNRLDPLIAVVQREYGANREFQAALRALREEV
jgi:hypothetical protein